MKIKNEQIELIYRPEQKNFSLRSVVGDSIFFEKAIFGVMWEDENGKKHESQVSDLDEVTVKELESMVIEVSGKHHTGWELSLRVELRSDIAGIELQSSFKNNTGRSLKLIDLLLISGDFKKPSKSRGSFYVFENGWQSWSPSGIKPGISSSRIPRFLFLRDINLGSLRYRLSWLKPGIVSEMFSKLELTDYPLSLVIGALESRNGFTEVFIKNKKVRVTCQAEVSLDDSEQWVSDKAILFLFSKELSLEKYAELVALQANLKKIPPPKKGWCSWYHHGPFINQRKILEELNLAKELKKKIPLEVILIDGGWCRWGDWLDSWREKFPLGMGWLAEKISQEGFLPGIWLAPFTCQGSSTIFKCHPDWFIKDHRGKPISVRKVTASKLTEQLSGSILYGLDPTHPAVKDYIKEMIRVVVKE